MIYFTKVHVNGSEVIGLTWMARISIAIDAAKGLKYFHETITKSPPVHGNIKRLVILYPSLTSNFICLVLVFYWIFHFMQKLEILV